MENVRRIMVVEDNEIDAFLATSIINHQTPEVEVVHRRNGKEALEYLSSDMEKPDMILLDLNMPVMDGFRFLEKLKDEVELHGLPIFILSSSDHHYDLEKSASYEVIGYYLKPLEIKNYQSMLESLMVRA